MKKSAMKGTTCGHAIIYVFPFRRKGEQNFYYTTLFRTVKDGNNSYSIFQTHNSIFYVTESRLCGWMGEMLCREFNMLTFTDDSMFKLYKRFVESYQKPHVMSCHNHTQTQLHLRMDTQGFLSHCASYHHIYHCGAFCKSAQVCNM